MLDSSAQRSAAPGWPMSKRFEPRIAHAVQRLAAFLLFLTGVAGAGFFR
jgi:hypothetical protein